jgi:acyl carrier protein
VARVAEEGMTLAVEQCLRNAVARELKQAPAAIDLDASVEEVGLDSAGLSEVVLQLEEDLGLHFSDEILMDFLSCETLRDIAAMVSNYAAGKAAES